MQVPFSGKFNDNYKFSKKKIHVTLEEKFGLCLKVYTAFFWSVLIYWLAKFEDYGFEDENRSGGSQNSERLTGEKAVAHPADEPRDEGLHGGHVLPGRLAEETPKSNDGRQAGEIQENPRCNALQRQRIFEIREVPATHEYRCWFRAGGPLVAFLDFASDQGGHFKFCME